MWRRMGERSLQLALPFILAVLCLAVLLCLFAGPRNVVHALSGRSSSEAAVLASDIDLTPPLLAGQASVRPPALVFDEVDRAPAVLQVCVTCTYTTIQAAVDVAVDGDIIQVAAGAYTDDDGDGYVVHLTETLTLQGGYTVTNWHDLDPDANPTVLDGLGSDRAIRVDSGAAPTIEGFHIRRGAAAQGAGVYVASGSPRLQRSRLYSNTASSSGGALYVEDGNALVENCLFYANQATSFHGGAIYVAGGVPAIRYSVLYDNQAGQRGGGIYVAAGSPSVVGAILADNAASSGGGIFAAAGTPVFDHNAYWSNAGGDAAGFSLGPTDVTDDPDLADPAAGDFTLLPSSPCINAGDATIGRYPAVDYDGMGRYYEFAPDIGAYESYAGDCFARVGNGRVYNSVQAAVDAASAGDLVKVAGLCTGAGPNVVTVTLDLTLRGGYTLTNWTGPDPDLYPTVLHGEDARRVIEVGSVDVTIEGFHIRNGRVVSGSGGGIYVGDGASSILNNHVYSNTVEGTSSGGGIYVGATSGRAVTISGNIIHHNVMTGATHHEDFGGGGIYVADGDVLIENNDIYENSSYGYGGGGISVLDGGAIIRGNLIHDNEAFSQNGGGGIYVHHNAGTVERNDIYGNYAQGQASPSGGGGIYSAYGTPTVRNNVIYDNATHSADQGGGIFVWQNAPDIDGNTIYGNDADVGGGAYFRMGGTVSNSIVASNTAGTTGGVAGGTCDYCDLYGNTNGDGTHTNSILLNPLFVQDGADFYLQSSSPCRGQADPTGNEFDHDGYARPFVDAAAGDTGPDIGAFEYYGGNCFARLDVGAVYPVVQDAINAAVGGESVYVAGHCLASGAPVAYVDRALSLHGGYTTTNWLTPSTTTILDGAGTERAVHVDVVGAVLVDGFVVRNCLETDGSGVYVSDAAAQVRVQNVVFYGNAATNGILSSVAGDVRVYNNAFVTNTVSAGAVLNTPAAAVVSNTIVVSNAGSALAGGVTCHYCDVWRNTGGVGGSLAGTSVVTDPLFVDPLGGDFHLRSDSPLIFAGDSNSDVDRDFEGDPRPLGHGYDIGADECAFYPGLRFEPKLLVSQMGIPGQATVHTHILTNTGSIADQFRLTHRLEVSGTGTPSVGYEPLVELGGGASTDLPVSVHFPTNAVSGTVATVVLTATSQLNPALYEVVTNVTYINWSPGVTITPVYTEFLNPGALITYVHTVENLGNAPDTFTLFTSTVRGWAWITPTVLPDVAPGARVPVSLTVQIDPRSPGGIVETVYITAFSASTDPLVWAAISDMFQVNHVPGDRFVATDGTDTFNNCLMLQSSPPCASVRHAVEQATTRDTVKVAAGRYLDHDLLLNKTITVAGGYTNTDNRHPSYWTNPNPNPQPDPELNVTVIDAQGQGRVLEILGNPTVYGFTLRGGATTGSGGGVYVGAGTPILRKNKVLHNTAASYGGGIYNYLGAPVIEQCWIGYNAANRGAGFASSTYAPGFWNNVLYRNTASDAGGGLYVIGGTPRVWHDTFYGNVANRGGGIYLYGGSATVSNTIVVSNSAAVQAGGIYSATPGARLTSNNVWGNLNGDYAGASPGPGSIAVNPGFISIAGDDYHLAPNSPCADVAYTTTLAEDLDAEPRVIGPGPDVGADEFAWGTIEFRPSYSGLVQHCNSIWYTHTVTHTGRYTDDVGFVWTTTEGVNVTVEPSTLSLGHNVSEVVTVTIDVPCSLVGPIKDTTRVTAISQNYAFISATVTETNYIDVVPLLEFERDEEATSPPGSVFYTHILTNSGNYTDYVTFQTLSSEGWTIVVTPAVLLAPGTSTLVTVEVQIDNDAVSSTVETTIITATSMFSYVVNGIPMSDTVVDTTTVAPVPDLEVTTPEPYRGLCIYPPENNDAVYRFGVRNRGNLTDTFTLGVHFDIARPWTTTIGYGFNWYSVPVTMTFAPDEYRDIYVRAEVPTTTMPVILETVWLTVSSGFDPLVRDEDWYSLQIIDVDVEIDDPVTTTFTFEHQITYTHRVTNTGADLNRIILGLCDPRYFTPPESWLRIARVTPASYDLNPGEGYDFQVTLEVPMDVHTGTTSIWLCGNTDLYCHAIAPVRDRVLVRRPDVTVEPDRRWQDDPEANVPPGRVITYTYSVSNTGSYTDDYAITWTVNPNPSWLTWTVSVTPTYLADLAPGQGITAWARMTVPAEVPMDTSGRLVVTATSQRYGDVFSDTAVAELIVIPVPMAEITPEYFEDTTPGTWITYTHILTNVGNRTDDFALTTHSEFGFSVVSPPMVTLAPGESYTQVVVQIYIPPYAEIDAVEQTEVIVTFHIDREDEETDQVVVVDRTRVRAYPSPRYVAVGGTDEDNNCSDPENYMPCATIQHAVEQAAPGDKIHVAKGLYADLHSTGDVTQVVHLYKDVILEGGYVVTDWETFDPFGNPTVLDADRQGRVISVAEGITVTIAGLFLREGYVENGNGAGIHIGAGSVATVEMNVIYNNEVSGLGVQGAGLYYGGATGLVLQQNTFHDNYAEGTAPSGGGVYIANGDAKVWNNVFYANEADAGDGGLGGALYVVGGDPLVWNNTFYDNVAQRGGGLYYVGSGLLSISNTIFAANSAADAGGGGGVYQGGGSNVLGYNAYWANVNADVTGTVPITLGINPVQQDPGFADQGANDLHLTADSPCVNAADPGTTVSADRDGKPRPLLGDYDIGAYEYGLGFAKTGPAFVVPGQDIEYTIVVTNLATLDQHGVVVTDTLSPYLDYLSSSPSGAYDAASRTVSWTLSVPRSSAVQIRLTAHVTDDLAIGTTITNVAWGDTQWTNVVTSEYRTCWVHLNDDPFDYPSIQAAVDASQHVTDVVKVGGYCVGVQAREGISQMVYLSKTLTLRGGYSRLDWNTPDPAANPTVLDARGLGRVIYISGGVTPTVEGFRITNGDASGLGGLATNDAGGGVYVTAASPTLKGNVVFSNTAEHGGGLCLLNSGATLVNNAIVDNRDRFSGSGMYVGGGSVVGLHNTIARNTTTIGQSHGVYADSGATVALTNTVLETHFWQVYAVPGSSATLDGVLWFPTANTSGNVTASNDRTALASALGPDGYHLYVGSEALDWGLSTTVADDIDGDVRPFGAGPDLGADELLVGMQLSKRVDPDPAYTGQPITYTIRVTNTGGVTLTVDVTDTLPAQVTPSAPQSRNGQQVAPGETWVWSLAVDVNAGYSGTLTNRVDVSSVEGVTATFTLTSDVVGTAVLTVTKAVVPATPQAGEPITYTILVTNTGDVFLHLTVTDVRPTQVTPNDTEVWTSILLTPTESWSGTLVVTPNLGYQGLLTNVVRAASIEGATGAYTLTTLVGVTPALTVTKVASDDPAQAGEPLTYTIRVTNTGNVTLTATITDYLPGNAVPGGVVSWPSVELPVPNGTWITQVVVTPSLGYEGWLTNVVAVTTDRVASETITLTTLVGVTPALTVTKVASDDPVQAGQPLTYTIRVTNTGNVTLTATITDYLPGNAVPGGVVSWPSVELPVPNGTWITQVMVTPNMGYEGLLTNVIAVTTDRVASETITLTTQVDVTPALTVTKVASDDPVQAGQPLTYTIRVTNTGNVTLTATITDYLPGNAVPGGVVSWTSVELPVPNGTWITQVVVTPNLGYEGLLTNVIAVTTDRVASETITLTTQVDVTPALTVTKVGDRDPVVAGQPLTYTIRVTNTGNVTLTATITDLYPLNATPVGSDEWTVELPSPNGTWITQVVVTPNVGYAGVLTNVVLVDTVRGATGVATETTISLAPLLSVTKQVDPLVVLSGDPITYTIRVTNTGTMSLTLRVTDTFPAQVTPGGQDVQTPPQPLLPGETWIYTYPVTVVLGYSGTLVNVVDVSSAEGATGTHTALSWATVTPALTVTKRAALPVVQAGETLTYTVLVTNTGNVTLTGTVTDILPADVTHITATGVLTWSMVDLAPDDVWTGQFTVTADWSYSGTLVNEVWVATDEGASGVYTETSFAAVTPGLAVTKYVTPQAVYAGDTLTYTISMTNTGNVTLNTTVTDVLSVHVTHVTATGVLTWEPVLVAPGGTWTEQFTVTVESGYPGTVTNVVWVETDEGATGVATATALSLAPAVTITKQANPSIVQAGEPLTYTIRVTNTGTVDLDGTFTDTFPAQVSPSDVMTWTFSGLAPGDGQGEQVVVTVALGYSGTLENRVNVTTDQGVSAAYTETTLAAVTPALTVTKRADEPYVLAGQPLTYTIRVTNTGNVTLTATITDLYPSNATPVGSDTWTTDLPVPNGTWITQVVVTPNVGYAGVLTNVVLVDTIRGATGVATETAISLAPYLSVTKGVDPVVVPAGEPLTYTVRVTNTGTMSLTLRVTDTFPAQVTPGGQDVQTPPQLLPGETWIYTYPVTVAWGYSGTLVNVVDVSSAEGATGTHTAVSWATVTPALTVTKQVDPFYAAPGTQVTYTVLVSNTGNIALNVTITDVLPLQVTPNAPVEWSDLIAPHDVWSDTITATVNAGYVGPLVNQVLVTSDRAVSGAYTLTSSACVQLADLMVTGPITGDPGVSHAFTATITPPTATVPFTYTWEADGQVPIVRSSSAPSDTATYNWAVSGVYTVTVTVANDCGVAVSRTHRITVSTCPYPLTDVTLSGPSTGYANATYTFTSTIAPPNATMPVTYTWSPPPQAGQGTPVADYRWSTPGTYDVTLVAENCGATVIDTRTITIYPTCVPLTGVNIAGPTTGYTDTQYTFVANLVPPNASTIPITYTWSPPPLSGQGTASAVYEWPAIGDQTISVTVENCAGTASDDHTITIQEVQPIFLPIVRRNYLDAPDLEITDLQIVWGVGAAPDYVLVTIRNNGPAIAHTSFWVDLYLDPSRVPVVGDLWDDLSSQGKAWYVRDPHLSPGGMMVLDTRDPDDPLNPHLRFSIWPDNLPAGAHMLYAQVDSYWRPYGLVLETDEGNNVIGQSYTQAALHGVQPTPYPTPLGPATPVIPVPPQVTPHPRATSSGVGETPTPAP